MAGGQVTTFPLAGNVLTGEESYPFDGRARSVDNVISAEQSCDVDAICQDTQYQPKEQDKSEECSTVNLKLISLSSVTHPSGMEILVSAHRFSDLQGNTTVQCTGLKQVRVGYSKASQETV